MGGVAATAMLVRKSVDEVYEALVDPNITRQFWFTKGSDRLDASETVRWDWEMYDVSVSVTVKALEKNKRILIEWPGYSGVTEVEWVLTARSDGTTFVEVSETGFTGDADSLLKQVADATQGFALMLAGMKAWLEFGIRLNLTADRYPAGAVHT